MIDTRELEKPTEVRTNEPPPRKLLKFVIKIEGRILPMQLIERWVSEAMRRAMFEQLPDETWYGEVPGVRGAWANESTQETAEKELRESLTGWVILKIEDRDRDIPPFGGIDLNVL